MDVYKDKTAFLIEGIKGNPDYYFFKLQYADLLYAKANYKEAIPYYTKALELRPDKIGIYNNRGSSYFYLGMFNEAIYDFTMSIEKAPFKKEYYLNRCAAYNKIGDVKNAMKDLNFLMECCANSVPEALALEIKQKWDALNNSQVNK